MGDGSGVAAGFDPEFVARAVAGPVLLPKLELPALRAVAEAALPAEFLLAAEV
jgi:hypothetical protein